MRPIGPLIQYAFVVMFEVIPILFRYVLFYTDYLTAIFILVVSSAVFLHDVPARAGDLSMGIAVIPIG